MINVVNVSKSFGRVAALRDVSLLIEPGERVAFVGSNGSGKTTLLRSLLGLLRISGRISINGVDVAKEPELALRGVAYIPQVAPPIDASVAEVVRAHSTLRGIDPAFVTARAARLGLDLAIVKGSRFRDLSGGMRQKLLSALALATDAKILICDEPTANLDASARSAFFEMISERPRDHVVILCSHRLEEVQKLVDRVVELAEGKLLRDASLSEMMTELCTYRVEVELSEASLTTSQRLQGWGFRPDGPRRFSALLNQGEKLSVLARILRELEREVADISVTQLRDFPATGSEHARDSAPRLRGVAS
ncbi:MAG TPA: ABC transporter ATP-binding protein [Polyangiaceae bacterium]|jgi:ABC-type multidrug transport system ATPase subunit